jgi:hypothetical protein
MGMTKTGTRRVPRSSLLSSLAEAPSLGTRVFPIEPSPIVSNFYVFEQVRRIRDTQRYPPMSLERTSHDREWTTPERARNIGTCGMAHGAWPPQAGISLWLQVWDNVWFKVGIPLAALPAIFPSLVGLHTLPPSPTPPRTFAS